MHVHAPLDALRLNVFAWNVAAKALYESACYVVHDDGGTEFGMHKRLPPAGNGARQVTAQSV